MHDLPEEALFEMSQMAMTKRWQHLLLTIAFCLAIAFSLLVFPSSVLWMVGFWFVVHSVGRYRGRAAWIPLVACAAVVIIKRPDWSPWLIVLVVSVIAAAAISSKLRGSQQFAAAVSLWILWLLACWESHASSHISHPVPFDPSRPIVCFGDSLTSGLSDQEAYPLYLAEQISVPVMNFGRAGITARDALSSLPEIIAAQPQAVVVELGGHDYLRGYGREKTRESLVEIIEACQKIGAAVVLIEIPRGFITDPFSGLERELARKYDLELVPDTAIRMLVLRSSTFPVSEAISLPRLSEDGLHPNAEGARHLANAIQTALEIVYGSGISSSDGP